MSLTFNEFKDQATKILNINLDGYKIKRVQRRTDSLMRRENVANYTECLELLKKDPEFKAKYLGHFTINTSEFFRNPESFQYLRENIFPELFKRNNKIKIWSAPCSNGSEPYTLAIILTEMGIDKSRYQILGSDLDPEILETAKKGTYGISSLKNVPEKILEKYFTPVADKQNNYTLNQEIIQQINFEKIDLINSTYKKDWDLILSRNFFIYLTKELKEKLTSKFVSVLKPESYLFLGNTEFIFNPEKFGLNKEHLSFYRKIN